MPALLLCIGSWHSRHATSIIATPSHDYVTLWKGEHEHGVPWKGEQVCHSLERGAEAWYSLERGVRACGALGEMSHLHYLVLWNSYTLYMHTHARMHARTHTHTHSHTNKMDKLGSCPYESRTPGKARFPGCYFRDYGPVQNKLLAKVLTGALTMAPVLVVWHPKSHLGHHWLYHNQWFCPA